jgi:hypothetical protein
MAELGNMIISLDQESIDALNNLARTLDQNGVWTDQRLLNILRDVWVQFSLERPSGRWSGGLSVLDDVFHELRAARMIDEQGREAG